MKDIIGFATKKANVVISEIVTLSVYWNWEYWKNQITIVSYSIVEKAKISKDKTFTGIRTKKTKWRDLESIHVHCTV